MSKKSTLKPDLEKNTELHHFPIEFFSQLLPESDFT